MCRHGSDRPLKCQPWIQDKSQKPGYELRNVIKFHEFPGAPPEVVPNESSDLLRRFHRV